MYTDLVMQKKACHFAHMLLQLLFISFTSATLVRFNINDINFHSFTDVYYANYNTLLDIESGALRTEGHFEDVCSSEEYKVFIKTLDLLLPSCIHFKPFSFRVQIERWLKSKLLTLKALVTTIDAQWEGMGDVGSARYEPALLPPCPTIRVLNYSN